MNRIQTACFALLASAFVLTAILIVRIDQKAADNAAQADQVVIQPAFSMMTARTRGSATTDADESLFVLDNNSGTLLVYLPNIGRKQLEPITVIKMSNLF